MVLSTKALEGYLFGLVQKDGSINGDGPKFCSYKITQTLMDNPEGKERIIDEAKAKEAI